MQLTLKEEQMLARIIAGMWLVGFLTAIGYDVFSAPKEPTYTSYTVVSKAQEYSYHKSSATQVNILILKNNETGKLENKNVTVETHFTSNVGDKIEFENNERKFPSFLGYLLISGILFIIYYLLCGVKDLLMWVFTGKKAWWI